MNLRTIRIALPLAAVLGLGACAGGGYVAQTPSMPAARSALRPEYRLFYDALQDHGDWVLIEPFGFLFRPRVDFATFRPYENGFWAPSDSWGWVWISADPFGWVTYHYGNWLWDRFQGWVWTPGMDWGPAWVSWETSDRFAGWAPLPPPGAGITGGIPGGAFLYAPLEHMGSTDLRGYMATGERLGDAVAGAEPIMNLVERDGMRFNWGPSFGAVERARGQTLGRVRIDEGTGGASGPQSVSPAEPATGREMDAAREVASSAARQAHSLIERGGVPPGRLAVPRPPATKEPPPAAKTPKRSAGAARDTTK